MADSINGALETTPPTDFIRDIIAKIASWRRMAASFPQPARINYAVIQVPPLDDAELALVDTAHPALAIPLKHTALRDLLHKPFFLDKALEIEWSVEKPVPQSEREFLHAQTSCGSSAGGRKHYRRTRPTSGFGIIVTEAAASLVAEQARCSGTSSRLQRQRSRVELDARRRWEGGRGTSWRKQADFRGV